MHTNATPLDIISHVERTETRTVPMVLSPKCGIVFLLIGLASGCTTFGTPRSAVVTPGVHVAAQASLSMPPGDVAGWFWSADCTSDCSNVITALDLNIASGKQNNDGTGKSFGFGINGTFPYLEGYWQVRGGNKTPVGIGARVGLPVSSWNEHQLYVRYDIPTPSGSVLINPGLFLHTGNSPNGENPGRFFGLVLGLGFESVGEHLRCTPGISFAVARASRTSFGQHIGPVTAAFATASLRLEFRP